MSNGIGYHAVCQWINKNSMTEKVELEHISIFGQINKKYEGAEVQKQVQVIKVHSWIILKLNFVLTVHVQHEFNSNANKVFAI